MRGLLLIALLGGTDLTRGRITAGKRGLRLLNRGAAALVELVQPLGLAFKTATRERAVEGLGVVADPFDVVHGTVSRVVMAGHSASKDARKRAFVPAIYVFVTGHF